MIPPKSLPLTNKGRLFSFGLILIYLPSLFLLVIRKIKMAKIMRTVNIITQVHGISDADTNGVAARILLSAELISCCTMV